MSADSPSELKFEIGHVLFIDIVGYSKLLIEEQKERLDQLTKIVLGTAQVRESTDEQLVRLPTGDGMALVFHHSAEEPARCALEIAEALRKHPEIPVRMGIHSGPVSEVTDVSGRSNLAGAGINMAQRVMDCGDAGHILLSQHVADDLVQYRQWAPRLRDLGECEVKHGVRLRLVNLYAEPLGNPEPPEKFRQMAASASTPSPVVKPKRMPWHEIVIALLLVGALIAGALLYFRKGAPAPGATAAVPEKSIAVLPFENLSDDKSNAYFSEGIQDEILTRLSKIAALKVISRTSTQKYKSAPDNLRDVGKQLGVANILEGSVQKIANAVHVNVQLIRAATDEHLWAESYNRKLDDVFGVEGEVANAIADQLQAKLSGAEVEAVTDKPTQNAAAYDAYLRGLSIEHNDYSYSSFELAARAYVQAVQLDPKFAVAWARLGVIRSFLYFNGVAPTENTAAAVKEAADRAMALKPEAGESWIAVGAYRYRVQRDFEAAFAAYQEALKRLPNNSFVYQYLGIVQRRLGQWQEAETNYKKALELDPRDVGLLNDVGNEFYFYLRRFDEGYAMLDRALQIAPDSASARANKVVLLQAEGRLEEADQELARIPEDTTDYWVVETRGTQALYKRHYDEAAKLFERKINTRPADQQPDFFDKAFLVNLGYCYQWMGNAEEARKVFARALQAIKPTPETVVAPDANGLPTILALTYAGLGDKEKALAQAQQAVRDYASDAVFKPTAEITLAQVQAHFGDIDSAIAALPHLLEVPAGLNAANLKYDPFWDPLRKDPRFQKIVASLAPKQ